MKLNFFGVVAWSHLAQVVAELESALCSTYAQIGFFLGRDHRRGTASLA